MLRLTLMRIRRDRITTPIWVLATALLALMSATAIATTYGGTAEREQLVRVLTTTPALLALRGVPDGGSVGAFSFMQVYTYLALMAGLMSTFLVVRHSRREEERGRTELLGAGAIGRATPLAAALLDALLANVLLAAVVALAFIAGGLDAGGSVLAGLATGGVGLASAGLAALSAQVAPTSRSANGLAAAAVGVLWGLRAIGDAAGQRSADGLTVTSTWPSWLSPIGWGQRTLPFSHPDAAPLLLQVALALVTASVALVVQGRRDLGSSLLRERSGRADGRIRSALGLAWRLHRGSIIGWGIGGAALGLLAGALASVLDSSLADQPELSSALDTFVGRGHGTIIEEFLAVLVGLAGALAAAAGVHTIVRARSDESDGRVELLLASPVGRIRWIGSWLVVAALAVAVVLTAAGAVTALSLVAAGRGDLAGGALAAAAAQLPAAALCVGAAAVLFALVPRVSVGVSWAALGAALLIGQFGGILDVPDAVRDASPFTHVPAVPLAGVDWSGAWWSAGIAIVLLALAVVVVRQRPLAS
ncbi:polyketide antibiotic transporter [Galbitalea sp. SE-J8]|uniref:polyketide antibiotic transporter n=1 Tax=Galbitalea sp. SE-J8 TaxID=3054952 RepID=UPI00259D2F38|nr:polyketide antibiotic transporter [Galbitalea sp. SE-J8]MDM4763308.1 polyketide antibiotic transporter [Galbitalea sp. SE-J8]